MSGNIVKSSLRAHLVMVACWTLIGNSCTKIPAAAKAKPEAAHAATETAHGAEPEHQTPAHDLAAVDATEGVEGAHHEASEEISHPAAEEPALAHEGTVRVGGSCTDESRGMLLFRTESHDLAYCNGKTWQGRVPSKALRALIQVNERKGTRSRKRDKTYYCRPAAGGRSYACSATLAQPNKGE